MMKVRIKSKEWYAQNKSEDGNVYDKYGNLIMTEYMSKYCGEVLIIDDVYYKKNQIAAHYNGLYYKVEGVNEIFRQECFDLLNIGDYLENELNEYGKKQVQEIIETHKIKEFVKKWEKLGH